MYFLWLNIKLAITNNQLCDVNLKQFFSHHQQNIKQMQTTTQRSFTLSELLQVEVFFDKLCKNV